jgi:hypothetical protein
MLIGMNTNPKQGFTPESQQALGIQVVRMPLWWQPEDVSGRFDYDAYARELQALGIEPLFVLDRQAFRHKGGARNYEWFIRMLAAAHPTVKYWQAGNEPDGSKASGSSSRMNAYDYQRLLSAARRALPHQYLISAGLVSGTYAYTFRMIPEFMACDGNAVHLYGQKPTGFNGDSWGVGRLSEALYLLSIQDWSAPERVWFTEFGGQDELFEDGNERAAYYSSFIRQVRTWGAAAAIPFCYSDQMVDGFGMLGPSGIVKPVYHAIVEAALA